MNQIIDNMMNYFPFLSIILFSCTQGIPVNLYAEDEEEDSARQYKTREEKREAAHRYEITNWLTLSAIAEIEQSHYRYTPLEGIQSTGDEFSKTVDIEVGMEASDKLKAEIIVEFDDDKNKFLVDEAIASIDLGKTEIELGKTYLPVGEYYSHFVTGSPVEFAETRAKGIIVSHKPREDIDFSLFSYKGKAKKKGTGSHSIDWGITTEMTPAESFTIGLGYMSDLADADDLSLDDDSNDYTKRVDALGVWSGVEFGDFGLTTEYISALDSFDELETDRNKPGAWNIEFTHFPLQKLEWTIRVAGSKEIEDEPRRQLGVAGTWNINKRTSLTLEYLRNNYKAGLAEDSQENSLDKSYQTGGRLNILF